MRRALLVALFPAASLLRPAPLRAQGEHAVPIPAGTVRFGVGGWWSHATDRYGAATPLATGLASGTIEPLGRYFGGDSLGTTQLPWLASAETGIRNVTGLTGYDLNLGRSRLTVETSVRNTPLRLDVALSRRLVVGVAVPIVRARTYAFQALPDTAVAASLGNVGWNPDLLSAGAFAAFRTDVDSALLALQTQAASGPPSLQAQAQALLDQQRAFLCGLYVLGGGNAATQSSLCWNGAGAAASPFLPVATTAAGDSIGTRVGRARTDYEALRQQYAAMGVTLPPFGASFALPTAALDSTGLRRYLSDPGFGIAAETLTTVVRTGIGDIELGGWFQVAAGPRLRSQVGGLVRLGTGKVDRADNFIDVGTGDGQTDIEVMTRNDIVFGPRLWLHAGGRFGIQMSQELPRRVSPYWLPLAPAGTEANLRRTPGRYLALDLVPNWQLDDAIGVGLGYHLYRAGKTEYAYVGADSATLGLMVPASILGEGTAVTRMRVGAGVTFSTLNRYLEGRARLPYRVTWSYQRTFFGRGGLVERATVLSLTIEAFVRPF
jgi:hypothetical protein